MKAYQLVEYAGPAGLRLAEVAAPRAEPEEVLVSVRAVGVNFPDLLMTKGQYQLKPELPVVPGCEVAGVVLSAPDGCGLLPGDEVAGFTWSGGFAETVAIPVRAVAKVPAGLTLTQAAGVVVNYHTTLFALERRARLAAGERVLVLGAAGGIGTSAVQVARGLGAHVVAGVADEAQCATALGAGAHEALVLEAGFSQGFKVNGAHDGPVDVIVDPLGDWIFGEAIRCLAPEGRIITIGFAAGQIPNVAVNRLLLKNITVMGAAFGAFLDVDPGLMARQSETLARLVAAGAVRPVIEAVYGFDELPALLEKLDQGEVAGKAVVSVAEGT